MSSFGERLKRERDSHGTSIDEISVATGIDRGYLEALERGDIEGLPGRAFGKLYIRAYAQVLGFDPRALIDIYDREEKLARSPSGEVPSIPLSEPRRVQAAITRWKESRGVAVADRKTAIVSVEPTVQPVPPPAAEAPKVRRVEASAETEEIVRRYRAVLEGVPAAETQTEARSRRSMSRLLLALVILAVAAALLGAAVSFLRGHSNDRPAVRVAPTATNPAPPEKPPVPAPTPPPRSDPPAPAPAPKATTPPPTRDLRGESLTVSEIGVGRRVVRHRLEGESDRFAAGDLVWCMTRIQGGGAGSSIRHAWIHEGRVVSVVPLRVGSPDWRTYSNKRVEARGSWVVEARDASGRVLGSASFVCERAGL